MRILPGTTIKLYSGVEIDNDEQLAFSSTARQTAYFESKLLYTASNCTMNKKTGYVRLSCTGSIASQCNYMSFINPAFDNKVVYCRITDYDYVNNECTEVAYVIDFFQTWMFDVTYEPMYIEREHLSITEHNKAEANPYDPSLYQFRTAEPLAIGADFEKLHYTVVDDESESGDGLKLFDASNTTISGGQPGILLYMSNIALDALDETYEEETVLPSEWFAAFEAAIVACDYGYYQLGTDVLHKGSGIEGSRFGSSFNNVYWIFYVPNSVATDYSIDNLLEKLTNWNCLSSIVAMYSLTNEMAATAIMAVDATTHKYEPHTVNIATSESRISGITSKKLLNYPFSYVRLIAPNGDIKELHYEMFKGLQEGGTEAKIAVHMDVNGRPTMVCCPVNYKMSGQDYNETGENMSEGILFNQFPTCPYTTDAFLAQVAAYSSSIIANNTTEYGYSLMQGQLDVYKGNVSAEKSLVNTVGGAIGNAASGNVGGLANNLIFGSTDSAIALTQADLNSQKFNLQANLSQDAYAALRGGTDNAVYQNLRETRAAYAANKYTPSTGDGLINYSFMSYVDVVLLHVQLNEHTLAQYDEWFKYYGYKSGRCGIPHVLSFIKGSTSNDELPEWVTINGKQSTYVQVSNCKVVASMLPVANAFKGLLEGGCRFIDGDIL